MLHTIFGDRSYSEGGYEIQCPVCQGEYNHFADPIIVDNDDYKNGWEGRGRLIVISVRCEDGHSWQLCFGHHKGTTTAFVRIIKGV